MTLRNFVKVLESLNIDVDEYCADLFSGLLALRRVKVEDLASVVGTPVRTLQGYSSSSHPIRAAKACTVIKIAEYLNVDPACLVGEKSINDIWKDEDVFIRNPMITGTPEFKRSREKRLQEYTRLISEYEEKNAPKKYVWTYTIDDSKTIVADVSEMNK